MTAMMTQLGPAIQFGGGPGLSPLVFGAVLAVTLIIIISIIAARYTKVPPNTVLVITGARGQILRLPDGTTQALGYRLVHGGGTFVVPVLERVDRLTLEPASIEVDIENLRDTANEPHRLTGLVQVRVNSEDRALTLAVEQVLNKTTTEIAEVAGLAVDSHLRTMAARRGADAINDDLEQFNKAARESVSRVLANMGLCVVSLSLRLECEEAM